jgi:hypothetical protein
LSPRALFAIGIILLTGWLAVASIWTDCEIIIPNSDPNSDAISLPPWCAQPALYYNIHLDTGSWPEFDANTAITKDVFAWILTVLYMVYLLSAGIAWRKERRATRMIMELGWS